MYAYTTFLVDVMRVIEGDELTPTDLPLGTLRQIVGLAERRIYAQARTRHNVKAWSDADPPVVVTDNRAPLPADFEQVDVLHFGRGPLEPVDERWLLEYMQGGVGGQARYFAEAGGALTFGPAVDDDTPLLGRYFCRLPALDSDTAAGNALFQAEPTLFLYAALAEGAPIFQRPQMAPVWGAMYDATLAQVNAASQRAAYGAGRIRVRPSTRLIG